MSDDLVRYSVSDRVALITVNDPNRRNAVTDEMSAPLRAAVEGAEADRDVHAVVITGAGKAFCAGADLSALGVAAEEGLLRIYDGFMAIANCVLPTIAAVNGAAVGAGMNLALAADVRIAGPHAMFDPCFQKLGIHPGGGATWMLQRGSDRRWPGLRCCSVCASTPTPLWHTGWHSARPTTPSPRRWSWRPPGVRAPRGGPGHQGEHARHLRARFRRHGSALQRDAYRTGPPGDVDPVAGIPATPRGCPETLTWPVPVQDPRGIGVRTCGEAAVAFVAQR
jgi:hypothetical protein